MGKPINGTVGLYTLEDVKKAFQAGRRLYSWSDFGVEYKWESFDDWISGKEETDEEGRQEIRKEFFN